MARAMRSDVICALSSLALSACATGASDELRRDVDALRADLQATKDRQEETLKRLAELEEMLAERAPAPEAKAGAHRPPRKLAVVKLQPPPSAPPLPTGVPFTEPSAESLEKIFSSAEGPQDGDQDFRAALGMWRAGDRAAAAGAFEKFALGFPRHSEADDALLVSGSLFYEMELYTRALEPLEVLTHQYHAADALPDGLLLAARCRARLEQSDLARAALFRLVDDFPQTDAAKQAKVELDRLPK